jgi:preprotein translocase subunit SecB
LFKLKDLDPTESDLRAFGTIGAVDIAHPYMRETVQSMTARMGLPPLVLDIRAPEPVEA